MSRNPASASLSTNPTIFPYEVDLHKLHEDLDAGTGDRAFFGQSILSDIVDDPSLKEIDRKLSDAGELTASDRLDLLENISARINKLVRLSIRHSEARIDEIQVPTTDLADDLSRKESAVAREAAASESAPASAQISEEQTERIAKFRASLEHVERHTSYESMNIEKLHAKLALAILDGKTKEEIREVFTQEMTTFKGISSSLFATDVARDGVTITSGGRKINLKGEEFTIRNIQERTGVLLSGEQFEYIKHLHHQGVYGASAVAISESIKSSASTGLDSETHLRYKSNPFCEIDISDPSKIVVRSAFDVRSVTVSEDQVSNPEPLSKTIYETDISPLRGGSFSYGLASAELKPKIIQLSYDRSSKEIKPSASVLSCSDIYDKSFSKYYEDFVRQNSEVRGHLSKKFIRELHEFKEHNGFKSTSEFLGPEMAEYVAREELRNMVLSGQKINDDISKQVCGSNIGPSMQSEKPFLILTDVIEQTEGLRGESTRGVGAAIRRGVSKLSRSSISTMFSKGSRSKGDSGAHR
jgi:hypothetical protein